MNKKLLLIIGIVVLVVAVPLIQARMRGGGAVEVQVEKLEPRSIQSSVLASGKLVHEEEVKLSTEEIGQVTAIYVDEGQKVARGELVLQIDDQRLRAAVDQQQASVRMQEIAIQRQQLQVENLRRNGSACRACTSASSSTKTASTTSSNNLEIAEVDLMSSRESLEQARAQLEQQEDRLSKTRVYSPIDGTVTTLDIKVGETAISSSTNIPGSSLMTIANPASIHTEVNVDEADIANVDDRPERARVRDRVPRPAGRRRRRFDRRIGQDRRRAAGPELRDQDPLARAREDHAAPRHDLPRRDLHGDERRTRSPCRSRRSSSRRTSPTDETRRDVFVVRGGACREGRRRDGARRTTPINRSCRGLSAGDEVVTGPDRVLRALEDGDRVIVADSDARQQAQRQRAVKRRCRSSSCPRSASITRWASSSSRPSTPSISRSSTTSTSCSSARRARASRR